MGLSIRTAPLNVGRISNKLFSEPRYLKRAITPLSLIESIGGLVTCANDCLK